jgi:hypothetical protein
VDAAGGVIDHLFDDPVTNAEVLAAEAATAQAWFGTTRTGR